MRVQHSFFVLPLISEGFLCGCGEEGGGRSVKRYSRRLQYSDALNLLLPQPSLPSQTHTKYLIFFLRLALWYCEIRAARSLPARAGSRARRAAFPMASQSTA